MRKHDNSLIRRRKELGLTQTDVCDRAGISIWVVNKIEKEGIDSIITRNAKAYCDVLGITLEDAWNFVL